MVHSSLMCCIRQIMRILMIFVTCLHFILSEEEHRLKRQVNSIPLVYPYGAIYKLVIGFALPIHIKEQISLVFGANFQYQYMQFQNITMLSQYYFIKEISREEREAHIKMKRNERLTFYRAFENLLETQGLQGQECVLRAICEAAQYPVEEEGLVGEIMQILLTPDYGDSSLEVKDLDWEESSYKDAAVAGRQMFDCPSIYSGCPEGQGILEMVTRLRDY